MEWAEQVGIGEMELAPSEFWNLTVREFHIKHAALSRREDRARSLMAELALLTGNYKPQARRNIERRMHALRRYPVKPWLKRD